MTSFHEYHSTKSIIRCNAGWAFCICVIASLILLFIGSIWGTSILPCHTESCQITNCTTSFIENCKAQNNYSYTACYDISLSYRLYVDDLSDFVLGNGTIRLTDNIEASKFCNTTHKINSQYPCYYCTGRSVKNDQQLKLEPIDQSEFNLTMYILSGIILLTCIIICVLYCCSRALICLCGPCCKVKRLKTKHEHTVGVCVKDNVPISSDRGYLRCTIIADHVICLKHAADANKCPKCLEGNWNQFVYVNDSV